MKTAYVDTPYIIANSTIQKEYQDKLKSLYSKQKNFLDSLYSLVKANPANNEKEKAYFFETKQKLQAEYLDLEKRYQSEVSNQITEYTLNYGKEKGFDYIFGANGQGSLMYADIKHDATKEVLEYINKSFNGN